MPIFKLESREEKLQRRLDAALRPLATALPERRVPELITLMRVLRPRRAADAADANLRIRCLTEVLAREPAHRAALKDSLFQLLAEKQWVHLLADSGILTAEGLLPGLWDRMGRKLLPDVVNPTNLRDVLGQLFSRHDDHEWVTAIEDERWAYLLDALELGSALPPDTRRLLQLQVLGALQVLAYRMAAIGVEPELVRNHPAIERYESPFLSLAEESRQFIRERQEALTEKREPTIDDKHLAVLLGQCNDVLSKIRRQSEKTGASISLTALLIRGEQIAMRMLALLTLLQGRTQHEQNLDRVMLFKRLVRAANRRISLRWHWSQHMALLATRIATNAGKTGEQYITTSRHEYKELFRSALGAGILVAVAAFIKLGLVGVERAPLVEAFVYSSNYIWCFVLMSAMHWTLATKQPAMTANRIAHSLDRDDAGRRRIETLVELIVRTSRSQFVAVAGNLAVVIPLAIGLGYAVLAQTGTHYLDPDKAQYLLREVDPFSLRTWFWASLTGVWLFLSGLISGYYDNKAVYDRIPQRVAQLPWLRRLVGESGATRVAEYLEDHLGALAGSLFFGIFLGSTAALGKILGLPLDTLHVTFASANTTFALVASDWHVSGAELARLLGGIATIGLINLLVSFGLALYVAMKARDVEFNDTRNLLIRLGSRLAMTPREFFFPPREPAPAGSQAAPTAPRADSQKPDAQNPS